MLNESSKSGSNGTSPSVNPTQTADEVAPKARGHASPATEARGTAAGASASASDLSTGQSNEAAPTGESTGSSMLTAVERDQSSGADTPASIRPDAARVTIEIAEPSASVRPRSTPGSSDAETSGHQHTLAAVAVIEGRGLFLGEPVRCEVHPAPADHGIVFERIDTEQPVRIPALVTNVTGRSRRTTLKGGGASVETIEHIMSAFAGLRIDNALVRIDGPELPAGDGSARNFVEAMLKAGISGQDAPRRCFRVREPIMEEEGDAMIVALPHEQANLQLLYELDYGNDKALPRQVHTFGLERDDYRQEIAPARTFSRLHEAKALWDAGMCQHLTPRDVLVIGDDGTPVENSFRFDNEPVRHKVLDMVGDLYLLGQPIHGRVIAYRSGHALNHRLVARMFDQVRSRERTQIATGADGPTMDIRSIMKLMRHRYPMLLVDRVVSVDGSRRAIGIKNVTINEPFFQGHYPGTPIMPGVLIVEAMAQLSGLLVSSVLEHTGKVAILLSLDGVKLRRPVVPGDQLVMEAETVRAQSRTAHLRCKAFVADQLAAEAQIKFIMVDAEQDERV